MQNHLNHGSVHFVILNEKVVHTCMPLNQLFHRNRHLLLHGAGVVHMAGDVEELRAGVPLSAEAGKPRATTAAYSRGDRHRFYIRNSCWATEHPWKKTHIQFPCECPENLCVGTVFNLSAIAQAGADVHQHHNLILLIHITIGMHHRITDVVTLINTAELRHWSEWAKSISEFILTHVSRKRGLQTGLALFTLDGLDQSRLLSANVSSGTAHHKHVKVVARAAGVLPDQSCGVCLVNGNLERKGLTSCSIF